MISCLLKLKDILFPIRREELSRFIPCVLLYCAILYGFSALRILKDAALVTAIGSEAISFAKIYITLPFTIIFTSLYIYLSSKINRDKLFYFINVFFIAFFVFYLYVSIVSTEEYQPFYLNQNYIDHLVISYPRAKWIIYLMQKWPITLFYLSGELYGIVVIGFLYWQFMNQYTDSETAKRLYPSLGIIAQIGLIVSGRSINMLAKTKNSNVNVIIALILVTSLVLALYAWAKCVMGEELCIQKPKRKQKISFTKAITTVMQSPHVFLIFLMVFCYGVTINLIEGPWKEHIRQLYPTKKEYTQFMGLFVEHTGWITILTMILSQNILRRLGWLTGALFTPVVGFITGSAIFSLILMRQKISIFSPTTILWLIVVLGAVQNILTKSAKYALFDPTKEMSFISLNEDLKTKGKAAVDMFGFYFSKSFGGFIQSVLFIIFPSIGFAGIVPYLFIIFIVLCILWLIAICKLNAILPFSKKKKEEVSL